MPAQRTRDTPLEVSVDSPATQPPALSIIAPTPRAFTFPSSHNLADSPFSSPSNSPFEPDLRHSFASSSIRPHSPDSSSIPTPPPTHKRRKSSSDVAERRPKKGDEDYIKRPENAFILFRRKCVEDREAAAAVAQEPPKKQRQADLSKQISQQWKSLAPEERQYWEGLAKEKKREHEQLYPDYVYRPQRTKRNNSTKGKKRATYDDAQDSHHFVLPVPAIRQHGRSASAPTPPPYQSFNIPNVFAGSGSCPTSPSLLPLIARRASHEDALTTFDYIPRESLMPPPMFPPTYDSNELLRTMYAHQRGEGLPPLTLPHELLQPGQAMCSPASSMASTSGPSSPNSLPFTPTTGLLSHDFSHISHMDSITCEAIAQADLHEQQLYQQGDLDLAGYSWDANSIWGASDLLIADDFDINSIPPIELDIPKLFEGHPVYGGHVDYAQNGDYAQNSDYSHHHHHHHHSSEQAPIVGAQLVGFDEMMAGKHY